MIRRGDRQTTTLLGFADPVEDTQRTFRAALEALARPGHIETVAAPREYPAELCVAAIALVLSLADHDTPVWLAEPAGALADYLRFHVGCPIVAEPMAATFALGTPETMPRFDRFAAGDDIAPERGATLIWSVPALTGGARHALVGPGIQTCATLSATGLPADFVARWAANRAGFPAGIDLYLAAGDALLGLPRTVTIQTEDACTSQ